MNNWNKDFVYENWKKGRNKVLKDIVVGFIAITILFLWKLGENGRQFLSPNSNGLHIIGLLLLCWFIYIIYSSFKYDLFGYKKGCNIVAPSYKHSKEKLAEKINKDVEKADLFLDDYDSPNESKYTNKDVENDKLQKLPYNIITEDIYLLSDYIVLGTNKGKVIVIPVRKLCFYGVKQDRSAGRYRYSRTYTYIVFFTENSVFKFEVDTKGEAFDIIAKLDFFLRHIANKRDVLRTTIGDNNQDDESRLVKKLERKFRYSREEFFELVKYR